MSILEYVAPSPTTIPTSFVPKQPVGGGQRFSQSGGNTFLVLSLIILGIALVASLGVFGYERYLMSIRDAKSQEVARAQESIDAAKVEEFIHMRDRFSAAKGLLDQHIALSNFFNLLESITLQNVRFNSLSLTIANDRSAEIQMTGNARTFNALAAQSSAFAAEKRIKRAIFSDIQVNENKTVSFALTADVDPKLLLLTAQSAPPAPVAAPTDTAPATSSTPLP